MEQCAAVFFTAPALPLVSETLQDEAAHPLQIERAATSPADVVQLVGNKTAVRAETSSGIKLCLQKGLFLLYYSEEPSVLKSREIRSRNKKLSSPAISIEKEKRKSAMRSRGGEKDLIPGAEAKEVGIGLDE